MRYWHGYCEHILGEGFGECYCGAMSWQMADDDGVWRIVCAEHAGLYKHVEPATEECIMWQARQRPRSGWHDIGPRKLRGRALSNLPS